MLLASSLLSANDAPLARIAEEFGYQTDTAFRREFWSPLAAWRKDQLARQPLH